MSSIIAEFREFFLRHTKVTTGATPDQEINYPTTYTDGNGNTSFNRFLKGDLPSEDIFSKLFNSLTFKLNKNDRASSSSQGLVKKSSDTDTENRLANPNTDFTLSVSPHQLPEIVTTTDGNDAVLSSTTVGNIKITVLRRTLSSLFRKNYLIEIIKVPISTYLLVDFSSSTNTPIVIGAGVNFFRKLTVNTMLYKFELTLFVTLDATGQGRVNIAGTAIGNIIYEVHYFSDATTSVDLKVKKTTLNSTTDISFTGTGIVKIFGSFQASNSGNLDFMFSEKTVSGSSSVLKGSTLTISEAN